MKKQLSKTLLVLMVITLLLAACGGTNTTNDNGNATNNEVTSNTENTSENDVAENVAEDSTSEDVDAPNVMEADEALSSDAVLDPALAADDDLAVLAASVYLYDTLVTEDGNGEGLAIEWSVSDDGLTYEFRLRANAVFSDGTPVNTDVVVENFTRWFDPEHSLHGDSAGYQAWVAYFDDFLVRNLGEDEAPPSKFDGIEKVDNLVFLLHLNKQMDNFLEVLSMPQFSILNPSALSDATYGTNGGSVSGSGAYIVDVWSADSLVLVPSSTYWGDAGSADMIVFSIK